MRNRQGRLRPDAWRLGVGCVAMMWLGLCSVLWAGPPADQKKQTPPVVPPKLTPPKEPRTIVDRWFAVTMEGRRIGQAHFTVVHFEDTTSKRTGWEYFIYPADDTPSGYNYWARFYSSVIPTGRPIASWVTGWYDGKGFRYRLKAGEESALFHRLYQGNWDSERQVKVSPESRLPQQIHEALGRVAAKKEGEYSCRWLNWKAPTSAIDRSAEEVFPKQSYVFEAMEELPVPGGGKVAAARFKCTTEADPARAALLWVDANGRTLRRQIPHAHGFELRLITEAQAKDGSAMTWSEAKKLWGKDASLVVDLADDKP